MLSAAYGVMTILLMVFGRRRVMSAQNVQDVSEATPRVQELLMKRTLPFTFLLMTVRDLSKQYPDRSTESDFWDWLIDQPEDIIGTAFYEFDLGVSFPLSKSDVTSLDWAKLGFTAPIRPQIRWLAAVQQATRAGATWSEAVARADEVLPFVPPAVA